MLLLPACKKSPQPSFYSAVVIFCNMGLRNAELRNARWSQVDFLKAEFLVGKAKTTGSAGRVIPLNQSSAQRVPGMKEALARGKAGRLRLPH